LVCTVRLGRAGGPLWAKRTVADPMVAGRKVSRAPARVDHQGRCGWGWRRCRARRSHRLPILQGAGPRIRWWWPEIGVGAGQGWSCRLPVWLMLPVPDDGRWRRLSASERSKTQGCRWLGSWRRLPSVPRWVPPGTDLAGCRRGGALVSRARVGIAPRQREGVGAEIAEGRPRAGDCVGDRNVVRRH